MSGDILGKDRAVANLTTAGSSVSNLTAAAANASSDLDCRTAGAVAPGDLAGIFELVCQFATVSGIGKDTVIGELYLLPSLDGGTNFPDIDTSSGASALPASAYAGAFVATKAMTANTNARFSTGPVLLLPLLYRPYVLFKAGQTVSANWSLRFVSARGQYT